MALRSLGTSLTSRASGTATRKLEEMRMGKPPIPLKGEPGTVERGLVEEPQISSVPGSEKVIRVAPGAESISQQQPNQGLAGGAVGLPVNAGGNPPGANGQALFQGNAPGIPTPASVAPTQAAPAARAGATPRVLGATSAASAPIGGVGAGGGSSMAASPVNVVREGFLPTIFSALSGRSAAAGGGATTTSSGMGATGSTREGNTISYTPTAGQLISGAVGKAISAVAPNSKLGAQMQSYGGAPGVAMSGGGSITSGLRSIVQSISKPVQQLRSLISGIFKKK